jgi:hypothetical protein
VDPGPDLGPSETTNPQTHFDVSQDVPYLTEVTDPNWDALDIALESAGPEAEEHGSEADPTEAAETETAETETAETETEVPEDPFGECDEQGIAEKWKGAFEGDIYYDIQSNGLLTPEEGIIPVYGELAFDVTCLNFKYIVKGHLSGVGQVETNLASGEYPFEIKLDGTYYPETGKLSAKMTDGVVALGPVEAYFQGNFIGLVQESGTDFVGTWDAETLGTNLPQIKGTAEGVGTWDAAAEP